MYVYQWLRCKILYLYTEMCESFIPIGMFGQYTNREKKQEIWLSPTLYDKCPFTNKSVKKAKLLHKKATKKPITQQLWTDWGRSVWVTTVVNWWG